MAQYKSDVEAVNALKESYQKLTSEIGKVIIGQEDTVRLLLTAIFCQGHCLLVGVPGLAKTLLIQTIAEALDLDFNRIQFTPDLMPSDIVGSETLDNERNFKFVKDSFLQTSFWRMKSTVLLPKPNQHFWKRCKNMQ
jgi:MoxR-like ATPase